MIRNSIRCASLAVAMGTAALPLAAQAQSPRIFVQRAIQGDNSEIMLGQVAQRRGFDPSVRRFGRTLVVDHTMARSQAMRTAAKVGARPPMGPAPMALRERARLEAMPGPRFDREFARYMVWDHRNDISEFRHAARVMSGPAGRLAREQLPTLQKHLAIAMSIENNTGRFSRR